MTNDSKLLKLCLTEIEKRFNQGIAENWTNSQYVELSKNIQKKTGISISVSSLRRLFSKYKEGTFQHNPQIETKNALARYIDLENWNALQHYQRKSYSKTILILIICITILALAGYLVFKFSAKNPQEFDVQLEGKYLVSDNFPHSVLFNYSIPENTKKKYYIDFNDGFCKPEENYVKLPADKQTITHFYILPDYYKVRLFRDKKLVRQEHVHIITNGWRKFVAYNDKENYLLVTNSDSASGKMHVSKAQVEKIGLKLPQNYWIKHRNIQDFEANTNNFTLQTCVKNDIKEGGLGCQMISLYVLGEHGRIHIKFSKPGCFSNISLQFGSEIIDGKFANLSAFSTDFSQWRKVKLVSINNDISVYLDSNLIFKIPLTKDCGNIKGLLFDTEGSGAMDYCYLKDENGEAVYVEEF